jgi:hypothetical protein
VIERFNFYDVYGYLLPGLVLLGYGWLPFLILEKKWPENQLLSAVVVLAIGYIVGHVLQNVATTAVPSKFKDDHGTQRYPSDLLLDDSNQKLTKDVKGRIFERAKAQFSVDLLNGGVLSEETSHRRRDAFLMARQALIRDKVAGYAEQFEGLYAMMRGFTVASSLACFYLGGWALALFKCLSFYHIPWLMFLTSLGVLGVTGLTRISWAAKNSTLQKIDKLTLAGMAGVALAGGYLFGVDRIPNAGYSEILGFLVIACLLSTFRFYLAYRFFAYEFATNVWRHYAYSEH